MKKELGLIALGALLGVILLGAVDKAAVFDGAVESTAGGFIFPDGTLQTTAAVTAAPPGMAPVEKTGQQGCWSQGGTLIPCPGTGQDGDHQMGVSWPNPRLLDNGDGTVTDNLTGLIWLKDAYCAATAMIWQDTLDWVADLNTMSIACTDYAPMTFTDWRLPNVKELLSLMDYGQFRPALPSGNPFVNVQDQSMYWSSTSYVDPAYTDNAYVVSMKEGNSKPTNKGGGLFAWPVRGGLEQ